MYNIFKYTSSSGERYIQYEFTHNENNVVIGGGIKRIGGRKLGTPCQIIRGVCGARVRLARFELSRTISLPRGAQPPPRTESAPTSPPPPPTHVEAQLRSKAHNTHTWPIRLHDPLVRGGLIILRAAVGRTLKLYSIL